MKIFLIKVTIKTNQKKTLNFYQEYNFKKNNIKI